MRKNPAANNAEMTKNAMKMNGREGEDFQFLRKGQVGGYLEELTEEFVEKLDCWTDQELKNSDFTFEF